MKAAAVACWVLAWLFAGLIPASLLAAGKGDVRTARAELATGLIVAGGLAWAGAVLW